MLLSRKTEKFTSALTHKNHKERNKMGYYINTGHNVGKAEWLIANESALELTFVPRSLADLSPDTELNGLICVVNNGPFEAAGFIYSDRELEAFTDPSDYRDKRWLVMPLERAKELSGYNW